MFTHRLGNLLRRIFVSKAERAERARQSAPPPPREATEPEIDEAVDESFPASDPPALRLEKDR
jgi:hypothetical protein